MTIDYGTTIHLPKTDFPRRGGLPQKEPEILKRWEKMGLYDRQRAASKGREASVGSASRVLKAEIPSKLPKA